MAEIIYFGTNINIDDVLVWLNDIQKELEDEL